MLIPTKIDRGETRNSATHSHILASGLLAPVVQCQVGEMFPRIHPWFHGVDTKGSQIGKRGRQPWFALINLQVPDRGKGTSPPRIGCVAIDNKLGGRRAQDLVGVLIRTMKRKDVERTFCNRRHIPTVGEREGVNGRGRWNCNDLSGVAS